MINPIKVALITLCASVLASCVSFPTSPFGNYTPPSDAEKPVYSKVVDAPFDKVWASLIDHISSTSFSIDTFEKDSGLMVISFGSTSQISRYVDCGYWEDNKDWGSDFKGKYTEYIRWNHMTGTAGAYFRANAAPKLTGKMNISVKKLSANKSSVRVNTRYILKSRINLWSFDTGGYDDVLVPNTYDGPAVLALRCRPTYFAEKIVLDALQY